MTKITFPVNNGYVSEGTVFTKKEAEQVAKAIKNSRELEWASKLIDDAKKVNNYTRPDALIPSQVPDTKSIESYVLSHGGQNTAGKTLAVV